jgi:hypothetical protein
LTGIGAYIFIALVEYLTSDITGQSLQGLYAWPADAMMSSSAARIHKKGQVSINETNNRKIK